MGTTADPPASRPSPARDWALIAAMIVAAHPVAFLIGLAVLAALLIFRDWLPFVWIALPVIGLAGIGRATRRPRLHGHAVRPATEPELAALVRQVAERLGLRVPLLVRIVAELDAGVLRTRASGVRTCTLFLGLPLVRRLTRAELAAVVAREFAYQQHTGGRRTKLLLGARDSLLESIEGRFRAPAAVIERLLRASQPRTWPLALAADAEAAAVAGTPAVRGALTQLGTMSETFDLLGEMWTEVLGEDGDYPEDLYEALDAALADRYVAPRMAAAAAEDVPMAIAIAPPLAVRLAALPEHPAPGWDTGAPVPLRDADALRRWCVRELVGSEDGPDELRPARLLDFPAERLEAGLREAESHLVEVTGQDSVRGAVAAAADAVAGGDWMKLARTLDPELAKLPPPMRATAGRDVLVGCLGRVIAGALLAAGWSRASRWTARVLVGPGGAPLDVEDLVRHAVDSGDPTGIRELLPSFDERALR
ncbi:M48 family metallopeptidase [Micromonospora eburnea]|uniref:Zn-dependent protease with chaperone function n=1 Tax=Micromonospora eburnea TaxID=227316 RepID=A0A1C6UUV1_9ACTN|nr:M48 family metallopeptidase [Micromonospora eburnea]SCL57778.1 hypothetical protein GA0070604_3693 [Micromonospora eburnea]